MNEKEVTIYDLARKLKISTATVSRAFNEDTAVSKKTKKKIFDLAEELGYRTNHFARNLRNQKTNTIGVIVPRLNSYFMSSAIAGMEHVATREGYNIIISQSLEACEKEIANVKTMFNNRVDGLVVSLAYNTNDISHFDIIFNKNIPLIFFDRVAEHRNCTNVLIDNRKAGYEVTKHLIKEGCRNIVHITASSNLNVYVDRLKGYKEALRDHDIEFKDNYVLQNNLSNEAGIEAAQKILKLKPRPDGVFVANDNCAVSCMLELKKAGIRIPEDIAFVGFNNDPVSTVVEPNLTTVNYPGYRIGEAAMKNLIDHLKGKIEILSTHTIFLHAELIIRASSQKIKQ